MTKRKSRVRGTPVQTVQDPQLWRYASLHDALAANVHAIADLIRRGEEAVARERAETTPEDAPYAKGA